MSECARTIDDAQSELARRGWSTGDMALTTPAGVVWMVYAHCGEHRIVVKAASQDAAWLEAVRLSRQ